MTGSPSLQQVTDAAAELRAYEYVLGVDVLEAYDSHDRHHLEATIRGEYTPPELCGVLYEHDLGVYRCDPQAVEYVRLLAR